MGTTRSAVLALDVGGSKVAAGLIDPDGAILEHRIVAHAPWQEPGGSGLGRALELATDLLEVARSGEVDVLGVGAGFPEYVDPAGSLTSREVIPWTVQPREALAALVPTASVAIESDVRCGALAEAQLGAGYGLACFLYVTLGTGLSSTLVFNGAPHPGRRGEAIAIGELDVPASIAPGWTGNLEMYASGRAVVVRYLSETGLHLEGAIEIERCAATGNPTALEVLATAGRALGVTLAGMVGVLDPDAIVIGGGLGLAGGYLDAAMRFAYEERLSRRPDRPPILPAALGPSAGMVGAALFVPHRDQGREDGSTPPTIV
jgi:glucokinase